MSKFWFGWYELRRARVLAISEPGLSLSVAELVSRYNMRWGTKVLSKLSKKVVMHERRMLRTLSKMTAEGYYQQNVDQTFTLVTKKPTKKG